MPWTPKPTASSKVCTSLARRLLEISVAESSDVDFVAVTAARPDAHARAALEGAHARLSHRYRRPWFDGLYVTWDDLARDPALTKECANSHDGRFQSGGGVGDPVTWHTLARHGVACRGPQRGKLKIWSDPGALKQRTLENFDRYWQRLLDHASKSFSLWRMAALTPYAAVWVVLGVTRLHYTLSTGDVCSKKDAASYALQTFPNRSTREAGRAFPLSILTAIGKSDGDVHLPASTSVRPHFNAHRRLLLRRWRALLVQPV
jgi:Domain of unknown function (DUF4111)